MLICIQTQDRVRQAFLEGPEMSFRELELAYAEAKGVAKAEGLDVSNDQLLRFDLIIEFLMREHGFIRRDIIHHLTV